MSQVFFWKGKKYKQFMRVRYDKKSPITCYEFPQGPYLDMPAGRDVKPVLRGNNPPV